MIVYAIAKYLVYSVWCYVGLRMLAGQMTPLRPALGFGAVRWLLGLVLGVLVFLAIGSVDRTSLAVLYLNPGSAGPRRFTLPIAVARLEVNGSHISHEIIELPV